MKKSDKVLKLIKIKSERKRDQKMSKHYVKLVKEMIKEDIKDQVSISLVNGTLVVDIYVNHCLCWHTAIPRIELRASSYMTAKIVADTVKNQYKQFILDKYFIRKKFK